jgi:hypothetical protein
MGEQKRKKENKTDFIFTKKNFRVMLIGIAFIIIGFILMSGGGSDDPTIFSHEIYNLTRIRIAPAFIITGFIIQVFAILKQNKN